MKAWINGVVEKLGRCMLLRVELDSADHCTDQTTVWMVACAEPGMVWLAETSSTDAMARPRRETAADLPVPLIG